MAFYCKNLEEIIFNKHKEFVKDPDELIIISGYLGPTPVSRLKSLPFKTTVIAGMYTNGMNPALYHSLKDSMSNNPNLSILFSKREVHSKIYIWMRNNKPSYVLIGSANFSDNGLLSDFRESLADMDLRSDTGSLLDYYELIKESSTNKPVLTEKKHSKSESTTDLILKQDDTKGTPSINLPLYKKSDGEVHEKSGLNWGNSKGHTAIGDAYIAIPKDIIKAVPDFFPPFDPNYNSNTKRKRDSDPIEIIWDDGVTMEASAEGIQNYNNKNYPKQITSYSGKSKKELGGISKKSILGRYLRKRMGIDVDKTITRKDLDNYGRATITFTKISDGVYSADFSVNK